MVANGMEGVPWMVGGGAKHSANVGRVLAYMATGGVQGVAGPNDLKVSPSAPVDGNVHVGVGALSILNAEGNARNEAYIGRATAVSDVPIASTGSSARSDLVVVRVRDPQYSYAPPTDRTVGPYIFIEVVPGVPANTTRADQVASLVGKSVYALSRVDVPANTNMDTSGVQSGWIKDLRRLAAPHQNLQSSIQVGPNPGEVLAVTDTSWKNWPSTAYQVDVPTWATHALVKITLNSVGTDGKASDFAARIKYDTLTVDSPIWDYNGIGGSDAYVGFEAVQFILSAEFDVRTLAGSTVTVRPQAMRTFTANTGTVSVDASQRVMFEVLFQDRVI
jgi:hypothetical protein